jgi:hypothetical protein
MHSTCSLATLRLGSSGLTKAKVIVAPGRTLKDTSRTLPLLEKWRQVGSKVLDDSKISQWLDLERITICHLVHMRAAIDGHRTRPAHTHSARESVGKRCIRVTLDPGHNVQCGLAVLARHGVTSELAIGSATPRLEGFRSPKESVLVTIQVSMTVPTVTQSRECPNKPTLAHVWESVPV